MPDIYECVDPETWTLKSVADEEKPKEENDRWREMKAQNFRLRVSVSKAAQPDEDENGTF